MPLASPVVNGPVARRCSHAIACPCTHALITFTFDSRGKETLLETMIMPWANTEGAV